jgi:hypothetical protein
MARDPSPVKLRQAIRITPDGLNAGNGERLNGCSSPRLDLKVFPGYDEPTEWVRRKSSLRQTAWAPERVGDLDFDARVCQSRASPAAGKEGQ